MTALTELITCPFCSKEVVNNSIICPDCGHHFNTQESDPDVFKPTKMIPVPHRLLMISAAGLLTAGSLMPWGVMVSMLGTIEIHGAKGDGVLTAVIGGILFLVALLPDRVSPSRRFIFIAGSIFSGGILFPKLFWFQSLPGDPASGMSSQIYLGLILAAAAVLLILASAVITRPKAVKL